MRNPWFHFQAGYSFRLYLKNKRHRYGVKIFKLCTNNFYTLQYKVYAKKETQPDTNVASKVVLEFMEPYLERNTYLVVTLRFNRKRLLNDVTKPKIKKERLLPDKITMV